MIGNLALAPLKVNTELVNYDSQFKLCGNPTMQNSDSTPELVSFWFV
jgi:hypothetical protein